MQHGFDTVAYTETDTPWAAPDRGGGAECDIYDCLVKSRDGPGLRRGLGYVGGVVCRQHPI